MKKYIKASTQSGLIGIWWYSPDGEVWGVSTSLDSGVSDGNYIQFSDNLNHFNLWRQVVKDNVSEDVDSVIKKGYKAYERGRVIFNLRTQSYEITCSDAAKRDSDLITSVVEYFNLRGCRYDVVSLNHYFKAELTGNPELDKFNYELY